jgi:CheY-like chemotaxis protein
VLNGNADPEPAVPRHLRLAGYRLTVCGDSAEACAILTEATAKGDPIPLAIVDSPTPMADAERLRQVDGGLKMIVVAELHRRPEWREQERAGISHCLPKPVSRALLLKTVAEALAELPRLEAKGPAQASAGKRAGQLRILVAEDNALNRELALALLRKLGCEAKTALNGAEAVKAAAGEEFDLILMDCHMPEVDGYEATRQIRSREAGRRHTTIFALTASAMDGERERCLAAGMDGFLTKPIHIGEFRAVVNACCERLPERGPAPGGAAACVAEISPARG